MPVNYFFLDQKSILNNEVIIKDREKIHQMRKVLRFKINDEIVVLDNSGYQYFVKLKEIKKDEIKGEIFKKEKNKNELEYKITLCQALLKHDKFEQVLKFGTSLGISQFFPLLTERAISRNVSFNKISRWQKIIKESAEQSGRGILPILRELKTFKEMIDFLKEKDVLKIIAWEEEKKIKISSLRKKIKKDQEIYFFVGPEGGFSLKEIELAKKNGFITVSLGSLILRAEIAGVVGIAILIN
jgi:16S rRNA (uracil1498-N3)-methyltransferase